jgi:hypothetical protein
MTKKFVEEPGHYPGEELVKEDRPEQRISHQQNAPK